jgi:hypothetical protein
MTTINYEKKADIYECSLLLEDNTEVKIQMREDGYIFATKLAKYAGKDLYSWKRNSETQKVIKKLEEKVNREKTVYKDKNLIEVYKGNSGKYKSGTWIHPDLGIHLAQWCSPSFSLQVSKWIRELIITNEVKIGNEKNNDDLAEILKKKLEEVEAKLKETEKINEELGIKLERTEEMVKIQEEEHKELDAKTRRLYINHQSYLRRKEMYKLNQGTCIYLASLCGLDTRRKDVFEIKVGNTGDVNQRMSDFRTANPYIKLLFVLYTDSHIILEAAIKKKFEEQLTFNNHEFISNDFETIKLATIQIADILNLKYTIENEENIFKFNDNIIPKERSEIEISVPEGFQRCGGIHHKSEESRILSLDNFFKNKGNKNGVNRLCKECHSIGRSGDKRKKRKVVVIPSFNHLTHKWCNRCEKVKGHSLFQKASGTKDGMCSNCKDCKTDQKRIYTERLKKEKKIKD